MSKHRVYDAEVKSSGQLGDSTATGGHPSPSTPSPERGAIRELSTEISVKDVVISETEAALVAAENENAALRAQLAERDEDTARLDWLGSNVAYIMLGARQVDGRMTQEVLHSRGHGYAGDEIRIAIDAVRVSADASKERKDG